MNKQISKPTLGIVIALAATLAHASAYAQVQLENTIQKVETYVTETGDVKRRLVDVDSVIPGDELKYTVRFTNKGELPVDAGTIVITDAIPSHTDYLDGTAYGSGTDVMFSVDQENFSEAAALTIEKNGQNVVASATDYTAIRWIFGPALEPGASGYVSFNVRLR